jgi:hypothetical protein
MIKCLETFGNFLEFVVWRAFERPQNRFTQGLVGNPRILVSCRFQKSKTHVFMSIDMVRRLKKITAAYRGLCKIRQEKMAGR